MSNWIKVEHELPPEDQWVLISSEQVIRIATLTEGEFVLSAEDFEGGWQISTLPLSAVDYWMPIPKLPKED